MSATVGGRYALDGRLGEGGMGQVYRARHLQLGKAFALKIISPAFALDTAARARFNEEAKLASEITHPNIVSVVDFGEDATVRRVHGDGARRGRAAGHTSGAAPMYDPPRVRHPRADRRRARSHPPARHRPRRRQGRQHHADRRDDETSSGARRRRIARLLDFGLARRPGGEDEEEISGSPHYLAPERAAGGPPSVAADVYALGVLGYLLLTGTLPFDGNVVEILMAHINQPPAPPSSAARRGDRRVARGADPARDGEGSARIATARAAAFRYELNTVMDMLDMGRRRPRERHDQARDVRARRR